MPTASRTVVDASQPIMPQGRTALIGRRDELAAAHESLAADRLVEIVGPPGVGKTRLAVELGHQAGGDWDDVVWVWLQPIDESHPLPAYVGRLLGISARRMDLDGLATALAERDRQTLLILDNAEHVAPRVRELVRTLAEVPSVGIVVTSRARLLDSDALILEPPSNDVGVRIVEAFRDEEFDSETRSVLGEFVERVGGLPLALRLGAARLDVLTPRQLAEHSTESGALDEAVRRSWENLDERQRRVMSALAVFRGGGHPWSIRRVANLTYDDTLEVLGELQRQSLVDRDVMEAGRYWLLPSLREFVEREVDLERFRCIHLEEFTEWSHAARRGEREISDEKWPRRLALERSNLFAAAQYAIEIDELRRACDIARTLAIATRLSGFADDFDVIAEQLWDRREDVTRLEFFGEYASVLLDTDRVSLAEHVLDFVEERSSGASIRRETSLCRARLLHRRGKLDRAVQTARRAVELARECGGPYEVAVARRTLAAVESASAEPEGAIERLREASQTFRELGAGRDEAMCEYLLAWAYSAQGRPKEFRLAAEHARTLATEIEDTRLTLESTWLLGVATHELGELEAAREVLEEGLADARHRGTSEAIRTTGEVLLNVYLELGRPGLAGEMLEVQARHADSSTDPIVRFWHTALGGEVLAHEGKLEEAAATLDDALARRVDHWNAGLVVGTCCHRAIVAWLLEDPVTAERYLAEARETADELDRAVLRQRCTLAETARARVASAADEAGAALEPLLGFELDLGGYDRRSSQCRLQARLIRQNLGEWGPLYEAVRDEVDRWLVAADGAWFRTPDGDWVSLRSSNRRQAMLACLAERDVADVDTIIARVWQGEKMTRDSALNRVRATVSMLRKSGLGDAIEHGDEGYRLTEQVAVWSGDV